MATRFIIGRAGTGKSKRCFDAIVAAMRNDPLGPAIFWLLPKQATFTAERQLCVASGLDGFCRAQVLSFEELGQRVLSDCGGAAVPHVTELGRQMVLGHLLRAHEKELRYFKSVARQAGLASELDATFAEFERCGKTSQDLADLVAQLESTASDDHQDQSLLAKLHDLRLLYDAYAAYLGQDRLDPHRRLRQVLECVESWPQMRGATAFIDGFLEFSDYERRVIAAMAKACNVVEITLLLDPSSPLLKDPHRLPDEMSLFHRTEDTYRKLWFTLHEDGVAVDDPLVLDGARRFENPALMHVESHALARRAAPLTSFDGIALIETPDRRAEVDAAARRVRDWSQSGTRYRDIAILARDLGDYHELIDASFREHDIPYFVDRRRTAAHHPLLQFTRAAFLVALQGWPHEAVISVMKSGFVGISLDDADELENYVLLHRIHGPAWEQDAPWIFRRVVTRAGAEDEIAPAEAIELARIDANRRAVVEKLLPFVASLRDARPAPIKQTVIDLFNLYERCGVRKALIEWMRSALARGELELHDEHAQVWANLVELFDQMADLLGDEEVSPNEFLDILEFGLERFDLALTPPTVDQVLVGSVERTRNPQSRAVILLGMNERQFPRVGREESILSDGERRALRERRLDLDPDTSQRLFDENLLAYIGLTRASHELVLTRALADEESRPEAPSPYWVRLRELFPQLKPHTIARRSDCDIDCIGTPRQLVTRLMRWARSDSHDAPWDALYQWLATHACCDDAVDTMRFRAWRALSYDNQSKLSSDVAARLFPSPLRASVSRIESFANCPFQHFVRYGLDLRPREDGEITALDLGNAYHSVLEKLVREMVAQKHNWTDVPPDEAARRIKSYAKQVGETLRGELMLSSARNKYLLARVERTLAQVIKAHEAAARRSRLRPMGAEIGFGIDGAKLPAYEVSTPKGKTLQLYGKVDRVDAIEGESAFAVIDYKLRGNTLELGRVYHGLSLQLLTYLLVIEASGVKLEGKQLTPAAAFYVKLMRQLERADHPDEALAPDHPDFHLQVQPRGVFDGRVLRALDSELSEGWSKVVKAHLKKDGTPGHTRTSDLADAAEFAGLLRIVKRRLGELADQVIGGEIGIRPYRMRTESPCPHCDYRAVCRFDLAHNVYHPLEPMSRAQVLERAVGEGGARP
jgi:ATP-dependent helicase/nuclease subunit B